MKGLRQDRPRKRRWKRAASLLLILLLAGTLALECAVRHAEIPASLREAPLATPVLLDRTGKVIAAPGNALARSSRPIPLAQVNPWIITATLAAEDHRFHEHGGIDLRSTIAASARNLRAGRILSGASTITQQLIKLHSAPAGRAWTVKIRENLAALRLERELSKPAILELYLNRIDFGNRLRGVEAASRGYFGKAAADLTLPEAVYLAGLPQAPSRYNPRCYHERAERRFQQVARRLVQLGWVSAQEAALLGTPPAIVMKSRLEPRAPHFVAAVQSRYTPLSGNIQTTLDLELQRRVEAIMQRHLERLAPAGVQHAAALVLDHQDGSVRAWCGSGNWSARDGQIDGVTLPRSSGSTLKPFLYLRAIDRKVLTASSLLPDTPDAIRTEYVDYDPRNYDDRFWGPVRVREALANSLNVPAVVALARTGARDVADYLQRCGIPLERTIDEYGAGMILGNAEVRMIDLAAAYGALAKDGVSVQPRLLESEPVVHRAIASPEATAIIADILADNDARRKTFGPFSPLSFTDLRIPCKTGTSSGFRDAWTFGVTGRHVVAVWVGNFSGAPMKEVASVTGPAPIWREIVDLLAEADGGLPPPDAGLAIERTPVCALTGLRPVANSKSLTELFLPGTTPKESAALLFSHEGGKTELLLPPEYAVWCRSSHNYLDAAVRPGVSPAIANPRPDARYVIDPQISTRRQKIELIAVGLDDQQPACWEIDGVPVEAATATSGGFWELRSGTHRLRVRQGTQTTELTFHVE